MICMYRIPQAQLPLTHPGEACGENVALPGEDGTHWPHAVMRCQSLLRK